MTTSPSPAPSETPAGAGPLLLTVALALTGWLAGVLWPQLLVHFGIFDYGTRFLDSYAVLAALDVVRAGADPHVANALDPLMRYHVYSDWWLALRWLGLTREHNVWVGLAWIAAFATTALATMRPRRWGEAWWLAVLLISPALTLVVNRANNDLVIFALLAGCGMAAAAGGWRILAAVGCLALATGLKYYPVVAVLPFLWVRPMRTMPAAVLGALVAGGLALAAVWAQVDRSRFLLGSGIYTMGAPLWWRDLGWQDSRSVLPGFGLLLLAAVLLVRLRITTGLASQAGPKDRLLAAMGVVVTLACFLAGVNYAYRWIFILWPAFWLWRQAHAQALPRRQRRVAAIACALIALALWQDGLFGAAINSLPPRTSGWVDHAQLVFRLWTQPLQWLLMALFAGWLLEAVQVILREWWQQRAQA